MSECRFEPNGRISQCACLIRDTQADLENIIKETIVITWDKYIIQINIQFYGSHTL